MRTTARRIDGGEPLRQALAAQGLGLQALARKTADADPGGQGVSLALVGFLTLRAGASRHARETCSVQTAQLIEQALGAAPGTLFDVIEAPSRSDRQPSWDDLRNVVPQ